MGKGYQKTGEMIPASPASDHGLGWRTAASDLWVVKPEVYSQLHLPTRQLLSTTFAWLRAFSRQQPFPRLLPLLPALTVWCTHTVTTSHLAACYHDKTVLVVGIMNAAHHWVPLAHQASLGYTSPAMPVGAKSGRLVIRLIQQEAWWCLKLESRAPET